MKLHKITKKVEGGAILSEFVISTYLRELQNGMQDTQENTVRSVLGAVTDCLEAPPDIPPKTITGIMKRQLEVPMNIKKATADTSIVAEAYEYFDDFIVNAINPLLLNEVCEKIHHLYNNDPSVSSSKLEELNKVYNAKELGKFLCSCFLYAINRENKSTESSIEVYDVPLLTEVNYKCPCCHTRLMKKTKNSSLRKYEITQIFPEGLEKDTENKFKTQREPASNLKSIENLIALCTDCSEEYMQDPIIEDYIKLYDLKKQVSESYNLQLKLDTIGLEEEIFYVIEGLTKINTKNTKIEELRMDALRISEKIDPSNPLLLSSVTQHVLSYYRYIEKLLSDFDLYAKNIFNTIASEVQLAYQSMKSMDYSQEVIYELVCQWMNNKIMLQDNNRYKIACRIVVSFFIQNCEVFDEITK